MAQVKNNILLEGIRGMLGKQLVYRVVKGRTIISMRPAKRKGPPTEKQVAARVRFREAREWAKEQLKDPLLAATYKAKCVGNQSALALLTGERMKAG